MDPMDQFFRKKLRERRHEYREAYWDEAELLISRRERRRRRAFWWWFSGIALVLVCAGGGSWWYLTRQETFISGNSTERPGQSVAQEDGTGRSLQVLPEAPPPKEAGSRAGQSNSAATNSSEVRVPAPGPTPGMAIPSRPPDVEYPGSSEAPSATDPTRKEKTPVVEHAVEEAELPGGKLTAPVLNLKPDSMVTAGAPPAAVERGEINTGAIITLAGPVLAPPRPLDTRLALPDNAIRPRRALSGEMALGASLYPGGGKRLIGGIAGLRASYRVQENILLGMGVQYRLRGGSFGASRESKVAAYRFGQEIQRYSLQPNRLHYLEALVQVEWPVRRHHFSAGLGWNYLLGVEGSLSRSVKEEFALNFGAASSQEKGWLAEDGYTKQFWVARAGYYYRLGGRWKAGLELQYAPSGILQEGTEEEPMAPVLKESGRFIIDLGIKYRL